MKIINIILSLSILYYINCEEKKEVHCSYTIITNDQNPFGKQEDFTPKSANDCKDRLTDNNKKDGDKCCYASYKKKDDANRCTTLDKYQYENFGKYFKAIKLEREVYKDEPETKKIIEEYGDYSLDCYSDFIKITLLSILLFLF